MKKGNRYDTSQMIENQYEEGEKKEAYFVAVRAGLDRDYELMGKIFSDVIFRSLKPYEKK